MEKSTIVYLLVLCEALTIINGHVNATTSLLAFGYYSAGTSVSFTCDPGYQLDGSSSISCLTNVTWDAPTSTCTQGNVQLSLVSIHELSMCCTEKQFYW